MCGGGGNFVLRKLATSSIRVKAAYKESLISGTHVYTMGEDIQRAHSRVTKRDWHVSCFAHNKKQSGSLSNKTSFTS